jgi:hypothetical protein
LFFKPPIELKSKNPLPSNVKKAASVSASHNNLSESTLAVTETLYQILFKDTVAGVLPFPSVDNAETSIILIVPPELSETELLRLFDLILRLPYFISPYLEVESLHSTQRVNLFITLQIQTHQ